MPNVLKNRIKTAGRGNNLEELSTIWVSCEGENPADVENIGPIQYKPRSGFPGFYFPFRNSPGYLSPLVAVWFEAPKRKNSKNNNKMELYNLYSLFEMLNYI